MSTTSTEPTAQPSATGLKLEVAHSVLHVHDADNMIGFYTEMLGFDARHAEAELSSANRRHVAPGSAADDDQGRGRRGDVGDRCGAGAAAALGRAQGARGAGGNSVLGACRGHPWRSAARGWRNREIIVLAADCQ